MERVVKIRELRETVLKWRKEGAQIALVPTMGNLHAGHIELITEARKNADKVVVSIFVNPTQFGAGEDYKTYPRTEIEDEAKLKAISTDLLFLPEVDEMYQHGADSVVSVTAMSKLHCGVSRPNHFDGVATIVLKLFNMVLPECAFFGEKDFQQLCIIRKMVQDLNIPIEIFGVATKRESDGLALSSRNIYLTASERLIAPQLYQSLCRGREKILLGKDKFRLIEQQLIECLTNSGFKVDFFSICRQCDLQESTDGDKELVILVAVKLGKSRLIDNVFFSRV